MSLVNNLNNNLIVHKTNDFTIKEKRDGQVVSEQKVKHKLTDNIDQIYECQFDSFTGERIVDNRRLRKIIKRLRRKACIECGTERHPHGTEYVRNILLIFLGFPIKHL